MKVHTYCLQLDAEEFKAQREFLLRLSRNILVSREDDEILDGLINLTDEIADQAHDVHGLDVLLEGDEP